jgi:hypothetical protein
LFLEAASCEIVKNRNAATIEDPQNRVTNFATTTRCVESDNNQSPKVFSRERLCTSMSAINIKLSTNTAQQITNAIVDAVNIDTCTQIKKTQQKNQ